jgi:hypothetical protein
VRSASVRKPCFAPLRGVSKNDLFPLETIGQSARRSVIKTVIMNIEGISGSCFVDDAASLSAVARGRAKRLQSEVGVGPQGVSTTEL